MTDLRRTRVRETGEVSLMVNCQGLASGFGLFVLPGGIRCGVAPFPWVPVPE